MADKEHDPTLDLDRDLRELAARIEYPTTPGLSQRVLRQIEGSAVGGAVGPERRGATRLPASYLKWAAAAAVFLLLLAVPILVPGVRDDLSGILTMGQGGAGSVAESGGAEVAEDRATDGAAQSSGAESGSAASSAQSEALTPGNGAATSTQGDFDRKIIKTAEIGIRSGNVRESSEEAQRVATQLGGSVQDSRINRNGGETRARLTLTVPSEEFEAALDELRNLGERVTTDTVKGEDVTEEFVDLESRERNLLATEESLLELYDESEDVNNTLSIQRELTNVRGEIEQVQGRIQYLEQRSATSRINLSVAPAEEASAPPGWSPAAIVGDAWGASLGFLQVIATAFLSVAVFSWWLVPVLGLLLLWWRTRRREPSAPDP